MACGEGSDCINRLTQVECLESECRCGGSCQNQRRVPSVCFPPQLPPFPLCLLSSWFNGLKMAQVLPLTVCSYAASFSARFTRRQYANIEVIETARKGYGLRAAEPIAASVLHSCAEVESLR